MNGFVVRGQSLKRGSGLSGFVFLLLHLHQNPLPMMLRLHLPLLCEILMMTTPTMTHLLRHIKRENSMHPMQILAVILMGITAIILILVVIVVLMSKIMLDILVQDIQGEIGRRRTP